MKSKTEAKTLNYGRGALFALGGPIVGILIWVVLWSWGFIASVAAFAMAWLTIWLFKKGAGGIDQKSLYIVLPYIVVGLILSILSGMVYDGLQYVLENEEGARKAGAWTILTSSGFWSFISDNFLHNSALWKEYTTDILIGVAFGALGTYGTVKEVLLNTTVATESVEPKVPSKTKAKPKRQTAKSA